MSIRKISTVAKCLLPKRLLRQNIYCDKTSTPKMSTVAKCLLWQNIDSQNILAKKVYCAKMFTPKMFLSRLNPEGPFGKEKALIHKEFSGHFVILLKTLQPVLMCMMRTFRPSIGVCVQLFSWNNWLPNSSHIFDFCYSLLTKLAFVLWL